MTVEFLGSKSANGKHPKIYFRSTLLIIEPIDSSIIWTLELSYMEMISRNDGKIVRNRRWIVLSNNE